MTKAPKIVLKAGTRTVPLSEVPAMLAGAIHPEPNQPVVLKEIIKAYLGPNGEQDGRTRSLTDEDLALLVEILGPPPQPGEPTTDEQWLAYIAAWDSSPRRPTWTPGRRCINAQMDAALLRAHAEESHKAALIKAIRAGSIVPLSHALVQLEGWTAESLDLGQMFVREFSDYASKFGISVSVEIERVVIRDLVDRISETTADRHPEKWQHATDPDPIRRTIVAAMNAHGWPADGIPGVMDFICTEIGSGRVDAQSAFNDLPCADVSLIRANPAQWYITPDAERHILQAIADAVGRTQESARQRSEQYEKQRVEKEAAGRYTLEEAATVIGAAAGERREQLLEKLKADAASHKLPMYEPGRWQVYRYGNDHASHVRWYYEEAIWSDLNAWLDQNEPRIAHTFQFPAPPPGDARAKPKKAETKQQQMNREFLRVISGLGLNPQALPAAEKRGGPGVRSKVATALGLPMNKSFEHHWDRALKDGIFSFARK